MSSKASHLTRNRGRILWLTGLMVLLAGAAAAMVAGRPLLTASVLLWGSIALILAAILPGSAIYLVTMEQMKPCHMAAAVVTAAVTIWICIWPMGLNPVYNGEHPDHRDQYERMAKSLLEGHLYLDYPQEELDALSMLDNPYDPQARQEADLDYRWDHAFYNGHYYMYFGVVPAALVFLPYRLVTGTDLNAYHSTQLFVALFILGMFRLLCQIARRCFPKLPLAIVLMVSSVFSVMSVWNAVVAPTLYCTANSSAVCFMIWSIGLFFQAVWIEKRENRQIAVAFFGSLCGALAFGCRPTAALANLLVLPMLTVFLKQRKWSARLAWKLLFAALPYAVIGVVLMMYNQARFDNPFEFGQAYQLTVADQHQYGNILANLVNPELYADVFQVFLELKPLHRYFPFMQEQGICFNFPMLLISFFLLCPSVQTVLRKNSLNGIAVMSLLCTVLIVGINRIWSPFYLERYNVDVYYLLGILCFLSLAALSVRISLRHRRGFYCMIMLLGLFTLGTCALLFLQSDKDCYLTQVCPEILQTVRNVILPVL